MSSWRDSLPDSLKEQINRLIVTNPESSVVLDALYNYLNEESENKKRKIEQTNVKPESPHLSGAIRPEEVIFELPQVSFQSPMRKKFNLTFHLMEQNNEPVPVLSIVNPATNIPEFSISDLKNSVRLCTIIPILGNTTNPQKKSIVSLCCWVKDEYASDPTKNDPIVCQVNLDLIKKQMIKSGKLPSNIEDQLIQNNDSNDLHLNAVHERIVDYFQRQFKLCGISLKNYLPSNGLIKNNFSLNTDNGVAISTMESSINDFIILDAHKGSKEGSLVFLISNEASYIIYGFKKPVLLIDIKGIKSTSYSNITRNTFNILISMLNEKNEEKTLEFSMIDQQYFQLLDGFIKGQKINDDSFNEQLREKIDDGSNSEQPQVQGENGTNQGPTEIDEDEEGDGDYQGAGGENSEVDEEYDSNAGENSDEDNQEVEEDGVFQKNVETED